MTVKQLKEQLAGYPDDAKVKVQYTERGDCSCGPDDYCYCGDYPVETEISYICADVVKTRKNPNPPVKEIKIVL